ncbi:WD repeat-containing protein 38 isoform 2-T2 [Sarcophilus harrisii]
MPRSAVAVREMPAVRGKFRDRGPRDRSPHKARSETTSESSIQAPPTPPKDWAPLTVGSIKYFSRHKGEVNSCAFSPDTRILLTCCDDNKVYMWGARTGNLLRRLPGHTGHSRGVETVSFSSDSNQLASGGWDHKVILWEVQTGQIIIQLLGHQDAIQSSDFSPNSEYLATGSWDATVRVWDLRSLDKIKNKVLEGHKGNVSCVCFSPSGLLASGSWDKTIRIWNPETGKLLAKLLGHLTWVKSMAFSADGLRMASSEYSEMVKIWDCTTGKCTESLRGVLEVAHVCAFTPDGKLLVSGSADHRIFGEGTADHQVFGEYSKRCQMSHSTTLKSTLSDNCSKGSEIRNLSVHYMEPGATMKRARNSTISPLGQELKI